MSNLQGLGSVVQLLGAVLSSRYQGYLLRISSAVFKSSIGFQCQRRSSTSYVAICRNIAIIIASPTLLWHPFGENQHQKDGLYPQRFTVIQIFFCLKALFIVLFCVLKHKLFTISVIAHLHVSSSYER